MSVRYPHFMYVLIEQADSSDTSKTMLLALSLQPVHVLAWDARSNSGCRSPWAAQHGRRSM